MLDVDVALTYLAFVEERHRVWELRQAGAPGPWTDDPILRGQKFTNVFRVLDYGSQFVVRELLEPELSKRDALMRCFLYRHTGRPEPWEYLEMELGRYPVVAELDECLRIWREYRGDFVSADPRVNSNRKSYERTLFTNAYLVFPQTTEKSSDKIEQIILLTKRLFTPGSPDDIVPAFLAASSQAERYAILRRNRGVGDFMSMQVLTDWGYSPQCGEDREDEFVVLGPGARRGAQALDPISHVDFTLQWAMEAVSSSPGCPQLGARQPSAMDIQNTLCEFSKYVRFQGRAPARRPFRPAHPGPQPAPVLPRHW